jgi:hypothetical protein
VRPEAGEAKRGAAGLAPIAWLAIGPLLSALLVVAFPRWKLAPESIALAVAAIAAALPPIVVLSLARRVGERPVIALALAGVGAGALVFLFFRGFDSSAWLPLATGGELAVASGVGGVIGWRVQHPGHILPAACVAAAADVLSVLHPMGASHAIAASERALPLLAVGAPVPGAESVSFALGVGDLTFAALLFGVAARHAIGSARVLAAVVGGALVSLALAAKLEAPIPALVAIGALAVAAVPSFRDVRRQDRGATRFAIAASVAVVGGMLGRALLAPR